MIRAFHQMWTTWHRVYPQWVTELTAIWLLAAFLAIIAFVL